MVSEHVWRDRVLAEAQLRPCPLAVIPSMPQGTPCWLCTRPGLAILKKGPAASTWSDGSGSRCVERQHNSHRSHLDSGINSSNHVSARSGCLLRIHCCMLFMSRTFQCHFSTTLDLEVVSPCLVTRRRYLFHVLSLNVPCGEGVRSWEAHGAARQASLQKAAGGCASGTGSDCREHRVMAGWRFRS